MTSLDLAATMMAEQDIEEGDDRAGSQLIAIDQALRLLTPLVATYDGTGRGTSLGAFLRLASVVPQSVGAGMLTGIADVGTRDPTRRDYKMGRFAANDDDCFEIYWRQRQYANPIGWTNDPATGYYVQPELQVDVPCAANVSTLLFGFAKADVQNATTSSSAGCRIALGEGSETSGEPSPRNRNAGGKVGPEIFRQGGDRPGEMSILHARVVVPAGEQGASVKQACSFRLRSTVAGSGATIGAAWMVIVRWPL